MSRLTNTTTTTRTTTSRTSDSDDTMLHREKLKMFNELVQNDTELIHCLQCVSVDLSIIIATEYRLATNHELLTRVRSSDCIQVGGRWFIPKTG